MNFGLGRFHEGYRMKKILLTSVATAALCSASAFAADMPVKAPYHPAPTVFDWSGFYIGGDLGWQGSKIGLSDPDGDALTYGPKHDSFALGAHIGAQRQMDQLVLGVEGAYITGFGHSTFNTASVEIFIPGGTGTASVKEKDIWSVGGRAGWAMGNWMPYITGGYANGSSEYVQLTGGADSARARTGGAYIGGGVEWALMNNWIFGVEYRHYDFSRKTVVTTGTVEPVNVDPKTDTVVARLSYKFDWGKAPVVAKY